MKRLLPALAGLLLAGCTLNFEPEQTALRGAVVDTALAQIGRPYRYAGNEPEGGFDCSGLVQYSYAQAGVKVPRSSSDLLAAGETISYSEARPGDLLFYGFDGKVSTGLHVALMVDRDQAVHAPGSGRSVSRFDTQNGAWRSRYIGAVRVLP